MPCDRCSKPKLLWGPHGLLMACSRCDRTRAVDAGLSLSEAHLTASEIGRAAFCPHKLKFELKLRAKPGRAAHKGQLSEEIDAMHRGQKAHEELAEKTGKLKCIGYNRLPRHWEAAAFVVVGLLLLVHVSFSGQLLWPASLSTVFICSLFMFKGYSVWWCLVSLPLNLASGPFSVHLAGVVTVAFIFLVTRNYQPVYEWVWYRKVEERIPELATQTCMVAGESRTFKASESRITAIPDFLYRSEWGDYTVIEYKNRSKGVYESDIAQLKATILAVRGTEKRVTTGILLTNEEVHRYDFQGDADSEILESIGTWIDQAWKAKLGQHIDMVPTPEYCPKCKFFSRCEARAPRYVPKDRHWPAPLQQPIGW